MDRQRWMDGRMDERMDGWTDGQTEGQMDRWMDALLTEASKNPFIITTQ